MKELEIDFRGKLIAILAPAIGGTLFFMISLTIDIISGKELNILDPLYLLENSIYAAAGAILTAALYASRFIISNAKYMEQGYLQLPWSTVSTNSAVQVSKIQLTNAFRELLDELDTRVENPRSHRLALSALQIQIEEQKEDICLHGRVQFVNPAPNSTALSHIDANIAESFTLDGYGLIMTEARRGDVVQATDFQNSRFWWLDPTIAFDFFSLNMEMAKKGVNIVRIFGRHHAHWNEDEEGAKQEIIALQAKIKDFDIYTINYADFESNKGLAIQPIDQLVLRRNDNTLPGIEWKITKTGDTEKVFLAFGEARLSEISANFCNLMLSGKKGGSLRKVEVEQIYDPNNQEDCKKVEAEFLSIARKLI